MFYRFKRFIRGIQPELVWEMFYEHDLKTLPTVKPKLAVELGLLDEQTVNRIMEVKKLNIDLLKQRLSNGDLCFVTEVSNRLVSYHWVQSKGEHYVQQTAEWEKMTKGEAVIYHVRVHKDFRGNRINGYVYSEILKHCKSEGLNRVWIYTNKQNISNRKGLEVLGFKGYKQTLSLKFKSRYYLLKTTPFTS